MKYYKLLSISIFVFVVLSSSQLFAQSSQLKNKIDEKTIKEEIRLKEFVKSFIKSLEKTKDISKISPKFFVTDFYQRFAIEEGSGDIFNDLRINPKLLKKLPKNLRYKFNVQRFNFNILPTMLVKNFQDAEIMPKELETKTDSVSDDNPIIVFGQFFPPQVFEMLKQTKILSTSFDNNREINTLSEFRLLLSEMESVLTALRISLNENNLPKSDSLFSAELQDMLNQANWSKSDGFCGKCKYSCRNLSSNTKYIYIGGFMLRLTILNINGNFKIFDTSFWEDASNRFPWSPCPEKYNKFN